MSEDFKTREAILSAEEEKRPYTMDDYRDDFGGLLAEEAEENARLNSWQAVDFDA